ncbi:MAG: thiosulfate/3-mercaptopyruvate sulfurtransferase [Pseudomonadota bacterium]|nr:thiosulfate/3-mercaptopyruvate sulfurtransferase [Pseudomonadota bacterium]
MRVKSSATSRLPLLLEPAELFEALSDENVIVIDLSMPGVYRAGHVPGAVWLSYPVILHQHDDTDCDVPPDEKLSEALSALGIKPEHHVVAYDSQGCPMAARLLWTLEEIGHAHFSMLNGGWAAWKAAGLAEEVTARQLPRSDYRVKRSGRCNILRGEIGKKLHDKNVVLLDSRTEEEFTNELVITDRGGCIPGAVHCDWMHAVNENDAMRMRPLDELRIRMESLGVTPDKEIITYCQTHMRSAYLYMVLKILGYTQLRGYAAGYSEWGNALDTPISHAVDELPVKVAPLMPARPQLSIVKPVTDEMPVIDSRLLFLGETLVNAATAHMPGIRALVKTYCSQRPFRGLRISGCLQITPGTGALVCALVELGASVRWADVAADETANTIATYLLSQRIPVFTCALSADDQGMAQDIVEKMLVFPGERMPHVLIDNNDEHCLLTISEKFPGMEASTPSLVLDEISEELNSDSRKLLVEMMLLAKWEMRACEYLDNMRIWAANPMVCHCNSVVMLKNTLCACA